MNHMNDYLAWRGDLGFDERPLNEADALVLSCLSYLDFTGFVPGVGEGGVSLSTACQGLLAEVGGDVSSRVRSLAPLDGEYLRQLASSRRFGDLVLHDYVDEIDERSSLQFAALCATLPDGDEFVSLRGTDSTLVGWREDFMLSFTVTEAQRRAEAYCTAVLRGLAPGRGAFLGGHSKGGNLVSFAALSCPGELRPLIREAYSFDGPGMAPEVMAQSPAELLGRRFHHVCPAYSVIGMLLSRPGDQHAFVRSDGSGMLQHDPMTWEFLPGGLARAEGLDNDARRVDDAIASWVAQIDLGNREEFVGELFDALGAGGATTFDEVLQPPSVQAVLAAAVSISDQSRELVRQLVASTMDAYRAAAEERVAEARQAAARQARELVRDVTERLAPSVDGREGKAEPPRGQRLLPRAGDAGPGEGRDGA